MSRASKQEFDVTVRMTQSEAGVSEERIARMRNELSQQALYFQQREQELQQQMSQVVHGVRAQAQGEVAQAAQQAAEATSAARVEAAQAVAWRLGQPRRDMEGAASSSQSATDAKMDQLLNAVSACMQQTAAVAQSMEENKRELGQMMMSKINNEIGELAEKQRKERQREHRQKESNQPQAKARDRERSRPPIATTAGGDDRRPPGGGDARGRSPKREPAPKVAVTACLLYTSPSPRDKRQSRMPSSA